MSSDTVQPSVQASVDAALVRRIEAAIFATRVHRAAAEFDWPECHKRNCQARHGSTDEAFSIFARQVAESVRSEILAESTTRPDVWVGDDEDPAHVAVYALATLMANLVRKTGTHVRAAALLIDAYPALATFPGGHINPTHTPAQEG